jgi:hypothetical protein
VVVTCAAWLRLRRPDCGSWCVIVTRQRTDVDFWLKNKKEAGEADRKESGNEVKREEG